MRRNFEVTNDPASTLIVGASATTPGQVVTKPFTLHGNGRNMAIALRVSGVTVAAGITANLWTGFIRSAAGVVTYRATADKSVSITAAGVVEIKMNEEDATDVTKFPLGTHCKVTIITGAGDAVTVDEVRVIEVDYHV